MKPRTKIAPGFSSVLALLVVTAGWGIQRLGDLLHENDKVVEADNLHTALWSGRWSTCAREEPAGRVAPRTGGGRG